MKFPEQYRFENSLLPAHLQLFMIPFESTMLRVIATDWKSWEHVSVSLNNRCPNWREMCFVKDLFWNEDEECIQFHPRKEDYINLHEFVLHIWKPPISIGEMLLKRMDEMKLEESK